MSMGDINMGTGPLLKIYNEQLAHGFWYIVAGLVGVILFLRIFRAYDNYGR